jgi:hypothetical protein
VLSALIGAGVFVHWLRTAETAPYTSLITVAVGGVLLAVLLGAVALLADLIARLKFQVEEILHESRRASDAANLVQPPKCGKRTVRALEPVHRVSMLALTMRSSCCS